MTIEMNSWISAETQEKAKLYRPWNPLTFAKKDELQHDTPETPAHHRAVEQMAKTRLSTFNGTAESPFAMERRLDAGLAMLQDRFADRDSFMIASLRQSLRHDHYDQNYSRGKKTPELQVISSSRSDLGRKGEIGFPGHTVPVKILHDELSAWVPAQGEQRDIKDVIAKVLKAESWEALRPAYQQQRAYQSVMDHFNSADHDVQTRIVMNKAEPGPETRKNVTVYSQLLSLHSETRGVLQSLHDSGALSKEMAESMNSVMYSKTRELGQPTSAKPLGDWAPHVSANVYVAFDAVTMLYNERGRMSPEVLRVAKSQMDGIIGDLEKTKRYGELIEMPVREKIDIGVPRRAELAKAAYGIAG